MTWDLPTLDATPPTCFIASPLEGWTCCEVMYRMLRLIGLFVAKSS